MHGYESNATKTSQHLNVLGLVDAEKTADCWNWIYIFLYSSASMDNYTSIELFLNKARMKCVL